MPSKAKAKAKLRKTWQNIAREAQDYRDATIFRIPDMSRELKQVLGSKGLPANSMTVPAEVLNNQDFKITQRLPEELLALIASGELSTTAVTLSFLRRAALAQALNNCITELLPEQALLRAKELDEYYQRNGRIIGPLHGLPISVKEMIGMKGLGLNAAYVSMWGDKASEDAHILQILWNAGAVFFARTTQPQTMMQLETNSNLYGVTVNPYNRNVSAGGSSGGEGALIGMRGSCLGVGSDIGGSIRSPAANCGIYGFKPTSFRVPTDGWCSTAAGADPIPAVIGPMSTSLEGVKLFMKIVLGAEPWLQEPALIPIPWRRISIQSSQRLKIGIMWNDGVVTPHPPVLRALKEVASALEKVPNIEVVDWKPHLHDEAWSILSSLYFTDGGAEIAETLAKSGEPWRPLTKWILKENPCVEKLNSQKQYMWEEEREAYRKEYAKVWNDTVTSRNELGEPEGVVDVILSAIGPGVAPSHNTAKYWGYTSQWNLLDYPAISFPVSKVEKELDVINKNFKPMTGVDEDNYKLYAPELFHGLPISLQLIGRRFEDEKVLAILEYIKEKIGLPFVEFP